MNWRAFWRGFASIGEGMGSLSIFPRPAPRRRLTRPPSVEESMRRDWEAVESDWRAAMGFTVRKTPRLDSCVRVTPVGWLEVDGRNRKGRMK